MPGALGEDLPAPLYHQLQSVLKAEIESRRWQAGEQLSNESKIAEPFGVSKITVRQALHKLAELGYIHREPGARHVGGATQVRRRPAGVDQLHRGDPTPRSDGAISGHG